MRPTAVPFRTSFEASCAVPVLPQTSSPGKLRARAGTAAVHHRVHAVDHFQHVVDTEVRLACASLRASSMTRCGFVQMPPVAMPPMACASCKRGDRQRALADGRRRSSRPRTTSGGSCASSIWMDGTTPSASCGRSIPVLDPKPRHLGIFRDVVDPHSIAERVEEHVAGLRDRLLQIDRAVAALQVAFEIAAVEARAAGAAAPGSRREDAVLKPGQRHERLERRSRRQLRLNRAVEQRLVRD